MDVEHKGRSDFAEYAELIGIDTLNVMAAYEALGTPPTGVVLYTYGLTDDEEPPDDTIVYQQRIARQPDGVLTKLGPERIATTLGQIKADVERQLEERLGDNGDA